MRFNMREDLFFGNIVGPIVGLIIMLAIYANILNITYISQLRWELLVIFTVAVLALIIGIGTGGHIAAITIEATLKNAKRSEEVDNALYYFHWPFGHKLTFVPTILIFYIMILFDLFKGAPELLVFHQSLILVCCALVLSAFASVVFVVTHVTRIMFYTFGTLSLSILIVLMSEQITLDYHLIAYFFTIMFINTFILIGFYRYSHLISPKLSTYIQSRFPGGDKVYEG